MSNYVGPVGHVDPTGPVNGGPTAGCSTVGTTGRPMVGCPQPEPHVMSWLGLTMIRGGVADKCEHTHMAKAGIVAVAATTADCSVDVVVDAGCVQLLPPLLLPFCLLCLATYIHVAKSQRRL